MNGLCSPNKNYRTLGNFLGFARVPNFWALDETGQNPPPVWVKPERHDWPALNTMRLRKLQPGVGNVLIIASQGH